MGSASMSVTSIGVRRLSAYALAAFALSAVQLRADAADFRFGTEENIRFIADTKLKGPKDERLYLGRKIAFKSFLIPYTLEDEGYVLGVTGDFYRYYSLPQGRLLEEAQRAGQLPNPLPPFELKWYEVLIGHSLWIIVFGMLGQLAYKFFTGTKGSSDSSSGEHRPSRLKRIRLKKKKR